MTIPILLQALSLVALLVMLVITMQMDDLPSSMSFNFMVMAVIFVVIGYMIELVYAGTQALKIARALQHAGVMFAYVLNLFACAKHFRFTLPQPLASLLFLVPLASTVPLFIWPYANLTGLDMLWSTTPVPWFCILIYYGYPAACLLFSVFILLYSATKLNDMRGYAFTFLFTCLLPPVAAILYYAGVFGDFNPYSMLLALCCVITGVATLPDRVKNWVSYGREQALAKSSTGYILLDTAGRYIESNRFVKKLCPELPTSQAPVSIARLPELQRIVALASALEEKESREIRWGDKRLRISCTSIEFGGQTVGKCIHLQDKTEIHRLLHSLSEMEIEEQSTGYFNRRAFVRVAEHDFRLALQLDLSASVIALAVDNREQLRGGHPDEFDSVMKQLSSLLRERFGNTDVIGCTEKGTFMVYLTAIEPQEAMQLAEELRHDVKKSSTSTVLPFTISAGICFLNPARHIDATSMVLEAEAALYSAKNTGGNRVCIGGPGAA